ncbi:1-phosphofructokinase family hexose kinase [Tunicatimonas pelagia]|uniref:1-phosphofructokinase family hexose kinase n=1 Tax=Tunicatimonas pelagia TaxID=931531 RepID=UPI002666F2AD|nr:hexose kinase [Tunicatimonas pelagia]WKN41317.1 hexose kinase [Tunicatimonas pelagia]
MNILTITFSPALDKSTQVNGIKPDSKLRCEAPHYDPGGGGVNVSRAIRKLGGNSRCLYVAGGPTGDKLENMLTEAGVEQHRIHCQSWTRENFVVVDTLHEHQYRFGMPGDPLSETEWEQIRKEIKAQLPSADYVVVSGSLPPHSPVTIFAEVARWAKEQNVRCIVDTSGEALLRAAEEGVYLLKPNLGELSALAGQEKVVGLEQEKLARQLINNGKCEIVVVSLGPRGAMLATADTIEYVAAPTVRKKSTVGAGDSMVGAMVLQLSQEASLLDVVGYGVAAGTAATMNEGTTLCHQEDVERLYQWIKNRS